MIQCRSRFTWYNPSFPIARFLSRAWPVWIRLVDCIGYTFLAENSRPGSQKYINTTTIQFHLYSPCSSINMDENIRPCSGSDGCHQITRYYTITPFVAAKPIGLPMSHHCSTYNIAGLQANRPGSTLPVDLH